RNRPEPAARSKLILSAVASELARTLFAFASFIHGQGAAAQFLAIEGSDSGVAGGGIRHGDEAEAAGFTGHAISDQRDFGDFPVLFEKILEIVLGGFEGKISYV